VSDEIITNMVELQSSRQQNLAKVIRDFICPEHPDRPIQAFCVNDMSFGCFECLDRKREKFRILNVRSPQMARKVLKDHFFHAFCEVHPVNEVRIFCLDHNTGVCSKCIAEECEIGKHSYREIHSFYAEVKEKVQKLNEVAMLFEASEVDDVTKIRVYHDGDRANFIAQVQLKRRQFYEEHAAFQETFCEEDDLISRNLVDWLRKRSHSAEMVASLETLGLTRRSTFLSPKGDSISDFPLGRDGKILSLCTDESFPLLFSFFVLGLGSKQDRNQIIEIIQKCNIDAFSKVQMALRITKDWDFDSDTQTINLSGILS